MPLNSLVVSRLDSGNDLLYGVPDQLLDKLQRVQNVAARIVVRATRYDHITSILETLHWLPVRYRIEYKVLLMTFKALHLLVPSYIADLLQFYQPCRTLWSSSDSLLTVRSAHHYGDRSFCIAAPRLWNSLPHEMRKCDCLYTFKRLLKTLLLKHAYYFSCQIDSTFSAMSDELGFVMFFMFLFIYLFIFNLDSL